MIKVLHDARGLTRSLQELGWAAHVEPLPSSPVGRQGVFVGWARRGDASVGESSARGVHLSGSSMVRFAPVRPTQLIPSMCLW